MQFPNFQQSSIWFPIFNTSFQTNLTPSFKHSNFLIEHGPRERITIAHEREFVTFVLHWSHLTQSTGRRGLLSQ